MENGELEPKIKLLLFSLNHLFIQKNLPNSSSFYKKMILSH